VEVKMKSITERASVGEAIIRSTRYAYSLYTDDLDELHNQFLSSPDIGSGIWAVSGTAFNAGFYAGIRCAINRGFSKANDPRKTAKAEQKSMEVSAPAAEGSY